MPTEGGKSLGLPTMARRATASHGCRRRTRRASDSGKGQGEPPAANDGHVEPRRATGTDEGRGEPWAAEDGHAEPR